MSPEQVRGLAVDHRADLFAFGAILYELVSGRRAFHRDTSPETMTAILNDHPPDLGRDRPLDPAGPRHIIDRCLEKSPSATVPDRQRPGVCAGDVSDASRFVARCRARHRLRYGEARSWIAWAVAALLLAALAPLVYQHIREPPAPSSRIAVSDSADRGAGGAGELQPVSGRPPSGVLRAWRGRRSLRLRLRSWIRWTFGRCLEPSCPSARQRFLLSGHLTAVHRRSGSWRQAQEARCVGRSAANVVRPAWRGSRRLVESRRRHHRREYGRRPAARARDWRRRDHR